MKVYPTSKYQLKKSDVDWNIAYNAEDADSKDSSSYNIRQGSELPPPYAPYWIYRCVVIFNIPATGTVDVAYFRSKETFCNVATTGYMLDGAALTGALSDYGAILDLPTVLGTYFIPAVQNDNQIWYGTFNATGRAFIESHQGQTIKIALYSPDQPPSHSKYLWGNIWHGGGYNDSYLAINEEIGVEGGYIWVEGTKLAYTDGLNTKRLKEWTKDGVTGQAPRYLWIEGVNLRYIDANGDERYITGTQEGATGKIAGYIWIEDTKLHYLDANGDERCFEGIVS